MHVALILLVAAGWAALDPFAAIGADATRPVRIMPVGDSITEGSSQFASYRQPLAKRLREAGIAFEYVGRRGTGNGGAHEGYSGKNAAFIADAVEASFASLRPDILLIHAGHNHEASEHPIPGIVSATERLIHAFWQANPHGKVLLAQVIPSGKLPKYAYIPDLNRALADLAHRLDTADQRVVLVDQAAGFNPKTDTVSDLVHPNPTGAEKMAERWFEAICPFCGVEPAPAAQP